MTVVYVVAAALLNADGEVLLAQRPAGKAMAGLWEFPGGKIEPGERPEQALVRELAEELSITVSESALIPFTFASHTYEKFHLFMPLFSIKEWRGTPLPNEGQKLAWVAPRDLHDYPAPAADIPLFDDLVAATASGRSRSSSSRSPASTRSRSVSSSGATTSTSSAFRTERRSPRRSTFRAGNTTAAGTRT